MSENRDVEIQDLRATIKELEDKLNEKLIENTNTHLKIKEAQDEHEVTKKNFDILKTEYQWLKNQYDNVIASIYDSLDELSYTVKHSNFAEVLESRNKAIQEARKKEAEKIAAENKAIEEGRFKEINPGQPVPKGYE